MKMCAKKIMLTGWVLALAITFVGCDAIVALAKDLLAVSIAEANLKIADYLAFNETETTIKTGFGLPSAMDGAGTKDVTVYWEVNGTAMIITGAGAGTRAIVIRPDSGDGNAGVVLTATLNKGSVSKEKEFTLTVLEK